MDSSNGYSEAGGASPPCDAHFHSIIDAEIAAKLATDSARSEPQEDTVNVADGDIVDALTPVTPRKKKRRNRNRKGNKCQPIQDQELQQIDTGNEDDREADTSILIQENDVKSSTYLGNQQTSASNSAEEHSTFSPIRTHNIDKEKIPGPESIHNLVERAKQNAIDGLNSSGNASFRIPSHSSLTFVPFCANLENEYFTEGIVFTNSFLNGPVGVDGSALSISSSTKNLLTSIEVCEDSKDADSSYTVFRKDTENHESSLFEKTADKASLPCDADAESVIDAEIAASSATDSARSAPQQDTANMAEQDIERDASGPVTPRKKKRRNRNRKGNKCQHIQDQELQLIDSANEDDHEADPLVLIVGNAKGSNAFLRTQHPSVCDSEDEHSTSSFIQKTDKEKIPEPESVNILLEPAKQNDTNGLNSSGYPSIPSLTFVPLCTNLGNEYFTEGIELTNSFLNGSVEVDESALSISNLTKNVLTSIKVCEDSMEADSFHTVVMTGLESQKSSLCEEKADAASSPQCNAELVIDAEIAAEATESGRLTPQQDTDRDKNMADIDVDDVLSPFTPDMENSCLTNGNVLPNSLLNGSVEVEIEVSAISSTSLTKNTLTSIEGCEDSIEADSSHTLVMKGLESQKSSLCEEKADTASPQCNAELVIDAEIAAKSTESGRLTPQQDTDRDKNMADIDVEDVLSPFTPVMENSCFTNRNVLTNSLSNRSIEIEVSAISSTSSTKNILTSIEVFEDAIEAGYSHTIVRKGLENHKSSLCEEKRRVGPLKAEHIQFATPIELPHTEFGEGQRELEEISSDEERGKVCCGFMRSRSKSSKKEQKNSTGRPGRSSSLKDRITKAARKHFSKH